jgi:hypothetical protein
MYSVQKITKPLNRKFWLKWSINSFAKVFWDCLTDLHVTIMTYVFYYSFMYIKESATETLHHPALQTNFCEVPDTNLAPKSWSSRDFYLTLISHWLLVIMHELYVHFTVYSLRLQIRDDKKIRGTIVLFHACKTSNHMHSPIKTKFLF